MATLADVCAADAALLVPTPHRVIELADIPGLHSAIEWREDLTSRGSEGIVVKSLDSRRRG